MSKKVVQTAGREQLGDFAPMFAHLKDSSLTYHLQNAKMHGVTKEEITAIITHATMYVGWPKGWAVFRLAKEVWKDEKES